MEIKNLEDLIKSFIRKSDGSIYVRDPEKNGIWISTDQLERNSLGWSHWTTDLFISFINSGSFDVSFTEEGTILLSDFYRDRDIKKKEKIKTQQILSGECYYCKMLLYKCECSHDD